MRLFKGFADFWDTVKGSINYRNFDPLSKKEN